MAHCALSLKRIGEICSGVNMSIVPILSPRYRVPNCSSFLTLHLLCEPTCVIVQYQLYLLILNMLRLKLYNLFWSLRLKIWARKLILYPIADFCADNRLVHAKVSLSDYLVFSPFLLLIAAFRILLSFFGFEPFVEFCHREAFILELF